MTAQPDHIEHLFQQARSGDERALEAYCDLARRGLLLIARRELPNHSLSAIEDIVHDTLEAFVHKRQTITGASAAYLRGILYNKINSELRLRYSGAAHVTIEDSSNRVCSSKDVEAIVESRDHIEHCLRAISRLEEPDRTLLLESLKGTTLDGIWRWYQTYRPASKYDAFKRRLYRARQRLWDLLENVQ